MEKKQKDVKGYEKLYKISNHGDVFSFISNKYLKLRLTTNNYYKVSLYKNKMEKRIDVHRLVALHFVNNPNNYYYIKHIDENKLDNYYNNLKQIKDFKIKKVYCNEIEMVFDSLQKAAKHVKISPSLISLCCNNKITHAGKHPQNPNIKLTQNYIS